MRKLNYFEIPIFLQKLRTALNTHEITTFPFGLLVWFSMYTVGEQRFPHFEQAIDPSDDDDRIPTFIHHTVEERWVETVLKHLNTMKTKYEKAEPV